MSPDSFFYFTLSFKNNLFIYLFFKTSYDQSNKNLKTFYINNNNNTAKH